MQKSKLFTKRIKKGQSKIALFSKIIYELTVVSRS